MRAKYGLLVLTVILVMPTLHSGGSRPADSDDGVDPEGMVLIDSGRFEMGAEGTYPDAEPVHTVELESFYIDRHEVTNGEFSEFVEATGHVTQAEHDGYCWASMTWSAMYGSGPTTGTAKSITLSRPFEIRRGRRLENTALQGEGAGFAAPTTAALIRHITGELPLRPMLSIMSDSAVPKTLIEAVTEIGTLIGVTQSD